MYDYMEPCILMYSRGKFRDANKLTQSNLAAYWDYPNEEATAMIDKDPEFVRWGKKIFAHARRMTPEKLELRGYPYRATKLAANAARRGEIEVVLY